MSEYSINLGDCVYKNRKRLKMTQAELAEKTGVTEQTIRKIEHGEGNPQLDVLCSLITVLGVNPIQIVFPQQETVDPDRERLEMLLADCTDDQVHDLLPVMEAIIKIVKGRSLTAVK